jgi:hypothetical protein
MTVIFGENGQYLGYYAANMVVDSILERAFAKIFEALGMLVGSVIGGVIGITIAGFTYATLQGLCLLYQSLFQELQNQLPATALAKDLDQNYIDCLLALPSDIFSTTQKQKVFLATGQTLFKSNPFIEAQEMAHVINQDSHIRIAPTILDSF